MDFYIGSIILVAFGFVPAGFAACDGSKLGIAQNTPLFALLGTQYGGDGQTSFCLPKLDGPQEGLQYLICVSGVFPTRQ